MHTTNCSYCHLRCGWIESFLLLHSPWCLSLGFFSSLLYLYYYLLLSTCFSTFFLLLHFVAATGKRGFYIWKGLFRIDQTLVCVFYALQRLTWFSFFLFLCSCFSEIPSLLGENCIIKDHNKGPSDWTILGPKKCIQNSRRNGMILHEGNGRIHKGFKTIQMDFQSRWFSDAISFIS